MLLFQSEDSLNNIHHISSTLSSLVQAWIIAERTNHRLVIDWPGIPAERLSLRPFFDKRHNDVRGAIIYNAATYPIENNKHLLQYYYRRIFTQIFVIKHPTLLPYAHKHIVLWREESFPYLEQVSRHHWCKTKLAYYFAVPSEEEVKVPEPTFTPGIVGTKLHEKVGTVTENWTTFLQLAVCAVVVSPPDPFIDVVVKCFRNKEWWLVDKEKGLVLQR